MFTRLINANKSESALKVINAKIEKDVKFIVDKLILSGVETIDFNVDGSSSKEAHEKKKKKRKQYDFVLKWIS